jgi:hypothetical protein
MSAALDQLADELAAKVVEIAAPALLAKLDERASAARPDPLLTVAQSSKHSGLTVKNIRLLIEQGYIAKAPGLLETKIRQSVLDAYGKPEAKKK